MLKKKILIIDDEQMIGDLLAEMIEKYLEVVVVTALSGKQALEEFNRINFDLVISDVLMPGMNGLDFLKLAKESKPKVPIIMMSGHIGDIKHEELMQAGACAFISKPFESMKMAALIKEILHIEKLKAPL